MQQETHCEARRVRYEHIGRGYARTRREDPELRTRIEAALGDARSVVNVGAGTGSYEPQDRYVIAVEPSDVMAAQRPPERVPAIRATASRLPLRDRSVDAAMTVLSIHHWDAEQEQGVRELRRVARGPVVIVTFDPAISGQMWLMRDYLPEVAEMDRRIFPPIGRLAHWLGRASEIDAVPISRDTPDWTLGSFWAHPERVLDPTARGATSGFARMPAEIVARVVTTLRRDLETGAWDRQHGHLRTLERLDVGMRMITSQ
jgi:SAM-dependent methyltransferase